jgi:phosphoribosylamine--glycine ligase
MQATTNGNLADVDVKFSSKNACCVILASKGYPTAYQKGFEITMTGEAKECTYVAGGALKEGKLVTSGGRVTGTTAIADTLAEAVKEAYRLSDGVVFENSYRRSDIGKRALEA